MARIDLQQSERIFIPSMINNVEINQCKYYTVPSEMPEIKNQFSIIHLNARSIKNKFDEMQNLLTTTGVDWSVVCVSGTWLKQNQVSSFSLDSYNVFASCLEDSEGGGSMLYVNKLYNPKER